MKEKSITYSLCAICIIATIITISIIYGSVESKDYIRESISGYKEKISSVKEDIKQEEDKQKKEKDKVSKMTYEDVYKEKHEN